MTEPLEHRVLFSKPFGTVYTAFGGGATGEAAVAGVGALGTLTGLCDDAAGNLFAGGSGGVANLSPLGVLNGSYGNQGLAPLPDGDKFIAEAVDSQDRVYAVLISSAGVAVARYTAAGTLDSTFRQNGVALVTSGSGFTATAVALEADGQPIVAGTESTHAGDGAEMRVIRLDANGALDTSFGSGGSLLAQLGTGTSATPIIYDEVAGISTLADGEILVGGGSVSYSNTGSGDTFGPGLFAVARVTAQGQLDSGYGDAGIVHLQFATGAYLEADGVSSPRDLGIPGFDARADGSVVFAGEAYDYFLGALSPVGTPVYAVKHAANLYLAAPGDSISASIVGIAALGNGGATMLTFDSNAGDAGMTSISSTGEIGETATTFSDADVDNEGGGELAGSTPTFIIATSGKIIIGGSDYILQAYNQGSGFTPAFGGFSGGTQSSANTLLASDSVYQTAIAFYSTHTDYLMLSQDLGNGLWTTPLAIPGTQGADQYFSLGLREGPNQFGQPYIAFYDPASQSLKLARSSDNGQTFKVITIDSSGNAGQFASLNFSESNNAPEITYYDPAHQEVKYATEDSDGKWVVSVVQSRVNVTDQSQNGLASLGSLGFAYFDSTTREIMLAQQDERGKWVVAAAAKVKKSVSGLSLSYPSVEAPDCIAYYDTARKELRDVTFDPSAPYEFTTYTAAAGKSEDVASVEGTVYAYSPTTDDIISYAEGGPPDPQTIFTHVGGDLQVADEYPAGVVLVFIESHTKNLVVENAGL